MKLAPVIGDATIDKEIHRFNELLQHTAELHSAAKSYLLSIRAMSTSSSRLTASILTLYPADTTSCQLDDMPNKLLDVANQHILLNLENFLARLQQTKLEACSFSDKHISQDHYRKKVYKLEEEKRRREAEGKPEKSKQIEKLQRNHTKLKQAESERTVAATTIVSKLQSVYESRFESLDPVVKYISLFKKEFFLRGHNMMQNTTVVDKTPVETEPRLMPSRPPPPKRVTSDVPICLNTAIHIDAPLNWSDTDLMEGEFQV